MKKFLARLSLAALALGLTATVLFPAKGNAVFTANNIMDDNIFNLSSSMNASQIDAFLNSFPSSCISTNNSFVSADVTGYNPSQGFIYGSNVSAGTVIYHAAQAYDLNPQVILATLQKEQSLVSGAAGCHYETPPTQNPCPNPPYGTSTSCVVACQYAGGCVYIAMGYDCPGYCVPSSTGFSRQIIKATWKLKFVQQRSLGNYNWNVQKPGWDNSDDPTTPYNGYMTQGYLKRSASSDPANYDGYRPVNSNSLTVHLDTGATASLYSYTPFTSGNQSFVARFEEWFGPTTKGLVTAPGGGVYKIEDGVKRPFPNEITFLSYLYNWSDILTISSAQLNAIPDGTVMSYNVHYRNGHLVRSSSGGMYVVENGLKRAFANEATFLSYSFKWTDATAISNAEADLIPDGTAMPYNVHFRDGRLVTSPGGGMYVVANGLKKPFPNEITFLSYSYKWSDALVISNAEIGMIPDGTPMPYNVHFRDGRLVTSQSGGMYVVDNGTKRPFPNEETFLSYSYKWSDALVISNAEIGMIPDGTPMPPKS